MVVIIFLALMPVMSLFVVHEYYIPGISVNNGNLVSDGNLAYFEIVREDNLCKEWCFLEYIVTSKGDVLKKEIKSFKRNDNNKVGVYVLDENKANKFLASASSVFEQTGGNKTKDCSKCIVYNMYMKTSSEKKSLSVTEEYAPKEIKTIMEEAGNLVKKETIKTQNFAHFYFEKKTGGYDDYHVFESGMVIKEIFGGANGELINADIYEIDNDSATEIMKTINNDFFEESAEVKACENRNYLWAFVEAKIGERYNGIYTCGEGMMNSDAVFRYLYTYFK